MAKWNMIGAPMKWILFIGFSFLCFLAVIAGVGFMLPKGHVASRHMQLHQTPETVYALIAGPSTWRKGVKKYEPIPETKSWREFDGYDQAITYEQVEAIPPRLLVTRIADAKLPFGGTWTYELTPIANGADLRSTDLRITEKGEVYNPVFRFLSRVVFGNSATIEKYLRETAQHFGEAARIEE